MNYRFYTVLYKKAERIAGKVERLPVFERLRDVV